MTKGCALYSEVEFLLRQELRETPLYNSLIEAVALGSTKLNEITQKSLVGSTSKASTYLNNLIELGIIEREFSVDANTKEKANRQRGMYRLTDNFSGSGMPLYLPIIPNLRPEMWMACINMSSSHD